MFGKYSAEEIKSKFREIYAIDRNQTDKQFRLNIATYELGDTVKLLVYETVFGEDSPEVKRISKGEKKRSLGDLIMQILMYADLEGYDFDELIEMGMYGLDNLKERVRKSSESKDNGKA
jgi:hypothetical protein